MIECRNMGMQIAYYAYITLNHFHSIQRISFINTITTQCDQTFHESESLILPHTMHINCNIFLGCISSNLQKKCTTK